MTILPSAAKSGSGRKSSAASARFIRPFSTSGAGAATESAPAHGLATASSPCSARRSRWNACHDLNCHARLASLTMPCVTALHVDLAVPTQLLVLIGGGEFSFGETREIDEFLLRSMPADRRTVAF